ncbi:MAG TPA: GNAT family N-acetyltransferase [Anaerolineae bacterium]|nr:GNAT family N-acetyltransferase [Anaerolineae bacterium]
MASMILTISKKPSGPRPLDIRRDLKQVVALIEEAFGSELDAAGWAALRELRMTAVLGPLLGLLLPPGQRLNDILNGFVWVEDGEIVGNVTVQRIPQFPSRYIIANVAVKRSYRGRGIASELMRMTLDYIAAQSGAWAMLQVREDNEIARGMYQRLGFAEIMTEYRLCAQTLPHTLASSLPGEARLRPLDDGDWQDVRYLLNRALPQAARWWLPTRAAGFRRNTSSGIRRRLSRWFGVGHKMRWGLFFDAELMGVLDVDVLVYNEHRIDLLLHPGLREGWSKPLLALALRYLQPYPHRPINAILFDYQQPAIEALREFGFKPFVTLVNMRKRIRAAA